MTNVINCGWTELIEPVDSKHFIKKSNQIYDAATAKPLSELCVVVVWFVCPNVSISGECVICFKALNSK